MKKTSIHDIAKRLNISAMTVTRTFNGSAPVALKTRNRIMKEAKLLNYYPNALVKGIKGHKTNTIGLVFNAATPETTASNINLILGELQKKDYMPYIKTFIPRESELKRILESYICQRVDAVIIWSDYPSFPYSKEIAKMLESFHAAIFVTCSELEYSCDQIVRSPYNAIKDTIDFFVKNGRRRPAIFASLPVNQSKVDFFIQRLKSYGLDVDANSHIDPMLDRTEDKSYYDNEFVYVLEKRFGTSFPFDSILVACDEGAAAVMKYLKKCNIKVPDDIAVVGYNNYRMCEYLSPSMASIDLNFNKAAFASIEMLFNRLNDKSMPQQIQEFPLEFIWRESAGTSMEDRFSSRYINRKGR